MSLFRIVLISRVGEIILSNLIDKNPINRRNQSKQILNKIPIKLVNYQYKTSQ